MKNKMSLITLTLLYVLIAFSLCGCWDDDDEQTEVMLFTTTPSLKSTYNRGLGYSAEVKGVLKNNSNKTYTYVSVTFTCYDENGFNLGTCMDSINYLGAGEEWRFTAQSLGFFDADIANAKCTDITYM